MQEKKLKVVVLGDSILGGIVLDKTTGRYESVSPQNVKIVENKANVVVDNRSVFGMTSKKAYARKLHMKGIGEGAERADIELIALGGNDCDFNWQEVAVAPKGAVHSPRQEPESFKKTMQSMIDDLKAEKVLPALMTLTPLSAERFFTWITKDGGEAEIFSFLKNVQTLYIWQEYYSILIRELAQENNLPLVDARKAFLKTKDLESYLCDDGIHLNEKGHDLIVDVCIETLDKFDRSALLS